MPVELRTRTCLGRERRDADRHDGRAGAPARPARRVRSSPVRRDRSRSRPAACSRRAPRWRCAGRGEGRRSPVAQVVDVAAGTGGGRRAGRRRACLASDHAAPCSAGGLVAEEVLEALATLLRAGRAAAQARRWRRERGRTGGRPRWRRGPCGRRRPPGGRGPREPAVSSDSPSSTSTASTPVRSVKLAERAARSSRPASIATRKSHTRSISPSSGWRR